MMLLHGANHFGFLIAKVMGSKCQNSGILSGERCGLCAGVELARKVEQGVKSWVNEKLGLGCVHEMRHGGQHGAFRKLCWAVFPLATMTHVPPWLSNGSPKDWNLIDDGVLAAWSL